MELPSCSKIFILKILSLVSALLQKAPWSQTVATDVKEEKSSEKWFAICVQFEAWDFT